MGTGNPAVDSLTVLTGWDAMALSRDWDDIEHELGTGLPSDYKALTDAFGFGCFADRLRLIEPDQWGDRALWIRWLRRLFTDLDSYARQHEPAFPYRFWPQESGLLPWADMDDQEYFCWHTVGEPNEWPIVVCDRSLRVSDVYPMRASEFLVALLRGTVTVPMLGDVNERFTAEPRRFTALAPNPRAQ
ncbi:SMI1/KNR4 family protein [Stackebrandtia soli]|uniref:SMI1/KNR4 family protein n=1 Tax=Stackebrandtia soli TaxID=1892856 RepID=UPI0039EA48FB